MSNLRCGKSKSCGNHNKIYHIGRDKTKNIHYCRAHSILRRCNDRKDPYYHNYGGRGIECRIGKTTDEVIKNLESIEGYFEGAQIDRIDNDGHYEIGNLRWVDRSVNEHNKRKIISTNTSGRKGISYDKNRNNWKSYMAINGVVHKRRFNTFDEAVWYRESLEEYYNFKLEIGGIKWNTKHQ